MLSTELNFKNLIAGARLAVPHLVLALMVLLSVISLPLPHAGDIRPRLVVMVIYYWAIYRPALVAPWVCFLAGIAVDMLSGMPPGLSALIFILIQWIVRDQRKFLMGQPYKVLWAVFGLVATLAAGLEWSLYGLTTMHWAPPLLVIGSVIVTMLIFPLVIMLLIMVHRLLPVASRAFP